jgi:hypothetical protein
VEVFLVFRLSLSVSLTLVLAHGLVADARGDGINGFGNGSGYTLNSLVSSPGPSINNGSLTLTNNGEGNQAASAFYNTPQSTGSFAAIFTYHASGFADGIAFVLQNDPHGLHALGSPGSGLAYAATAGNTAKIVNSVGLGIDFYGFTGGPGTNLATQGASDIFNYLSTSPVNFNDPVKFTITYDATARTLSENLVDLIAPTTTYSHTFTGVNVASEVGGNSAYVGFTGGTGGLTSTQIISDFQFQPTSTPEPGSLMLALVGVPAAWSVWRRRRAAASGPGACATAQS